MGKQPCFEETLEKKLHADRTMALLHERLAMSHSEKVEFAETMRFKNWKAVMAEHYPTLYKKIATEMGMPPLESFQLPHLPERE